MNYLVLDLEYNMLTKDNTIPEKHSYVKTMKFEIMQIGCILLNSTGNYQTHCDYYTKLLISYDIDKRIRKITGITNTKLSLQGINFKHAIALIRKKVRTNRIKILTWGSDDEKILKWHTNWYSFKYPTIFDVNEFINIQRSVQDILMLEDNPSLKMIAELYGCNVMTNDYHSAIDDAYVLADITRKIGVEILIEVDNICGIASDIESFEKPLIDSYNKFNFIDKTNYYIDKLGRTCFMGLCLIDNKLIVNKIIMMKDSQKYQYVILNTVKDSLKFIEQFKNALIIREQRIKRKREREIRKRHRKRNRIMSSINEE